MIELTTAFKEAIKSGPLKYLIQISEDNGVSWQDLPDGAQAISPLGEVSGETEIEPFEFVGADCQLSCYNANGYWTNSSKTGKLDLGTAVRMRIKISPQSITNEWVQLIDGYIDIASVVNYRTEFYCVFTIRGCLNILDTLLANYVLADISANYPHKFDGQIQIVSVDAAHPDGLYELRYDGRSNKIYWDNGPGSFAGAGGNIVLTGQSGNTITVAYNWSSGKLPKDTVSQWIAIKSISGVMTARQTNPTTTLATIKNLIGQYVDLNIENVSAIPIVRPDQAVINYRYESIFQQPNTFTYFNPRCIVPLSETSWIISYDGGILTGNYLIEVDATDYFKVTRFVKFDPSNIGVNTIILNYYIDVTGYLYLLCEDSATRKNTTYNYISDWKIHKYNRSPLYHIAAYAGSGYIYYNSFYGYGPGVFYAAIQTSGGYAKSNKLEFSGLVVSQTPVSTTQYLVGLTMAPATILVGQFYVVITGYVDSTENKVKPYLQIYDIVGNTNYTILTDINIDYTPFSSTQNAPLQMVKNDVIGDQNLVREELGLYVMVGPMVYDTYNSGPKIPMIGYDKKIYKISFGTQDNVVDIFYGNISNTDKYLSIGATEYMYVKNYGTIAAGMSILWLSGPNNGIVKTIASVTSATPYDYSYVKLTFNTPLTYPIQNGDKYRVYKSAFDLTGAKYTYDEIELDGIHTITQGPQLLYIQNLNTYPITSTLMVGKESAYDLSYSKEKIYINNDQNVPLFASYNTDGSRILVATKYTIQIIDIGTSAINIYPNPSHSDFNDKTLREAIEELAISANAHIMPSEHNKKLSLIYRGKSAVPIFNLSNTEYKQGPQAAPYINYDAIEVNGRRAGIYYAGNKQRDLTLKTQCSPESYSQSLAIDILENIGSGDRTHQVQSVGRVELEPGDEGYFELEDGTTKQVMILGHTTDPETLDRAFIIREF